MRSPEAVSAMLCPICKLGLTMSDRQGVEIDYCPQCRGVWLDRGELDKIIERSEQPAPQPAAPAAPAPWPGGGHQNQHGGYDPRYGHQKRKKSFLQELFD